MLCCVAFASESSPRAVTSTECFLVTQCLCRCWCLLLGCRHQEELTVLTQLSGVKLAASTGNSVDLDIAAK